MSRKITVVLVDDDPGGLRIMVELISREFPKVSVVTYLSGRELMAKLDPSALPLIIIMDYDLSRAKDWLKGDTYTKRVKTAHPGVRVIGCCASNDAEDLARRKNAFLSAGADGFIEKEAGVEAFLAEIEKWLPEAL
ncbi:MAG: response regulator [Patescibacteria group bacterium]